MRSERTIVPILNYVYKIYFCFYFASIKIYAHLEYFWHIRKSYLKSIERLWLFVLPHCYFVSRRLFCDLVKIIIFLFSFFSSSFFFCRADDYDLVFPLKFNNMYGLLSFRAFFVVFFLYIVVCIVQTATVLDIFLDNWRPPRIHACYNCIFYVMLTCVVLSFCRTSKNWKCSNLNVERKKCNNESICHAFVLV